MKRGQVTIYVILGLVIFIAAGIIFFLKYDILNSITLKEGQKIINVPPQVQVVYDYVQDCVETGTSNALYIIGQNGGYFITPELSTLGDIPYYFIDNNSYVPTKEDIEKEISKYINAELPLCIDDFKNLTEFRINQGNINTKTYVGNDKVLVSIRYLLNIQKGDISYQLEDFSYELKLRLGLIYDASKKIVNSQIENPENICISCILRIEKDNDVFVNIRNYGENIFIYSVVDPNFVWDTSLYGSDVLGFGNYHFKFAMRY